MAQNYNIELGRLGGDIRHHFYLRPGSPEEIQLSNEIDAKVNRLLNSGVITEQQLREMITREVQSRAGIPRENPQRIQYETPAEREERRLERAAQPMAAPPMVAPHMFAPPMVALRTTPPTARPNLDGEDEDVDTKDVDQLKEMIKCPICVTNIKDVRLSPCGHMMCKTCAKQYLARGETKCPVCQQRFTNMDKVYYAKYLKYKNKYLQLKTKSF